LTCTAPVSFAVGGVLCQSFLQIFVSFEWQTVDGSSLCFTRRC